VTPLLRFVLAVIAGLVIGLLLPMPQPESSAGLIALVGLSIIGWTAAGSSRTRASGERVVPVTGPRARSASPGAIVAGAVLLGLGLGVTGAWQASSDCRARIPDGARVAFRGAIASLGWPDASVELRVDAVSVDGAWQRCPGAIRMRPPRGAPIEPGRPVTASGRWYTFPPDSRWPSPPERAGFLAASSLEPGTGEGKALLRLRGGVQARLRELLPRRAAIAEALLLARREGLDAELKRQFAAAGLTHLLAISGTHVGLVAGVLLLLAGIARLPVPAAAAVSAAGAVAYVLFLGAPHAASRAALQLIALLLVRALQRPADPYTLLAASALVLVAVDPLAVLNAGFQLSYAGIFGLLEWRRPIAARLPDWLPRWASDGLAAGTAATLATAPIAALHFGIVAPIAIIANLVAVPLVAAAVPALGVILAAGAVWPAAGRLLGEGADAILAALDAVAAAAAAVPAGHATVARPAVLAALVGTALAILVARRTAGPETRSTRPHGRGFAEGSAVPLPQHAMRRVVAFACIAAALVAWPLAVRLAGDGAIRIHAIDVGQGDALAIRTPAGRWIVVDAGPRTPRFDAGRARVVPFLLDHGVRRIDLLVLSHPDADHIGGVEALFETFDVLAVVDPAIPTGKDMYLGTLTAARNEGSRWIAARAGRELRLDDVVLEFLAPSAETVDAPGEANDYSAVFRLSFGRFAALFLGDAPAAVENEIVAARGNGLVSHVLKVGHHGSRTSTGDSLLAAASPRVALVSVGLRNRYGHPDPGVVARLARRGVRILRTDRHGTVTVRASAGGEIELLTTR